MNDRVNLPQAREVCPTTTHRLIEEGALLVDVRERTEVAQVAFDVPDIVVMSLSELKQRFAEPPHDRELVMADLGSAGCKTAAAVHFSLSASQARQAPSVVFDAIWNIKPRLLSHGCVANPRDTARYRCGLRLALTQNPSVLLVPSSAEHHTSPSPASQSASNLDAATGSSDFANSTCCSPAWAAGKCC